MREFLTGLAIILIVALTTALIAPYFVDWNSQRGFLEGQLSRALGQKVTIGGDIDLKLLPTPYLRLNQTVVGGDDGAVSVGIRYLDLELSVSPLLHGEIDIVEGRLEEPTIRVTLQPDRTLPALPDTPALRADVRIERVTVADGTLAVADPTSGRTFVLDNLDFTAEAPSLAGPFRIAGLEGQGDARTKFRVSTTEARRGKTKLHLAFDETAQHAGLDLDGTLALAGRGETVRQSFDGMVVATGHLKGAGDPMPWRLSGPLKADPASASLDGGELRIGGEESGLTLQADGTGTFGETAALAVTLAARQLDVDRLSGAPVDARKPPPPTLPDLATLRRILAAATPPLPTVVDVSVDTATWGGETLNDVKGHLGLGGAAVRDIRLSGDGPGGLHVAVAGDPTNAGFAGTAELAADDLPKALGWLNTIAPAMTLTPADLPAHALKFTGRIAADAKGVAAQDAKLDLDRTALTGAVRLALGEGVSRVRLALDLKAKALDLDAVPSLATLRDGAAPFDLDLKLDAASLKIAQAGDGALDAGRLTLALTKSGRRIDLSRFHAENFGGADVDASGRLDAAGARLTLRIDAARLGAAAALARQLAPGGAAEALVARAPSLAPAHLQIDVGFGTKPDGSLTATEAGLSGTLASTRVSAKLAPQDGGVAIDASAEAPQGGALLRQLGFPTLPVETLGASRVALAAHGRADRPLETHAEATLGATRAAVDGAFDILAAGHGGSGAMSLKSPDLGPLLQSLALAFPDMTGRIPVDVTGGLALGEAGVAASDIKGKFAGTGIKGTLRWQAPEGDAPAVAGALDLDHLTLAGLLELALGPSQGGDGNGSGEPFGAGLVDPPKSAVTLRAARLDLLPGYVAEGASLDLGIAPNLVTLKHAVAGLSGGQISGDVTLRRDGGQATLEGGLATDKVALDLPALKGTLTGKLDLAGGGGSPRALVASLAGSGAATLADAIVPGLDPRALPRVFAEVEADELAVDDETIQRALDDGKGTFAAGTRRFGLALAAGVLKLEPKDGALAVGPIEAGLGATLDLRVPRLSVEVGETLRTLPKNWTGPPPSINATLAGPPWAPKRGFDVSPFLNAVAARAIARESARIEAYEVDLRERAFFNQRLQSERRREQDRAKAEVDARIAAEAARKAAEAARKAEADRRRAADKAAADRAAAEAAQAEQQRRAEEDARAAGRQGAPPDPQGAPAQEAAPQDRQRFEAPPPGRSADPSAAGRY